MTCFTFGISKPLAATAVATMIGVCPVLNLNESYEKSERCMIEYFLPSESLFTFSLSSISMDAGDWESFSVEEIIELISSLLGLHKDQSSARLSVKIFGCQTARLHQIQEEGSLVLLLDPDDLLGDVLGGGPHPAHRQEHVVTQEVPGEHLDLLGEGGGEHEGLPLASWRHVVLLHDPSDLGLETHVQHSVRFVKTEIATELEGDLATVEEIHKTTRSGHEKMTSTIKFPHLIGDVGSAVDHRGTNTAAVGELASLVVDLRGELTGGSEHEGERMLLAAASVGIAWWRSLGSVLKQLAEDGNQECSSFTRSSLN